MDKRRSKSEHNAPPRGQSRPRSQRADLARGVTEADADPEEWLAFHGVLSKGQPEQSRWDAGARRRVRNASKVGVAAGLLQYAFEELRVNVDRETLRPADAQSALRGLAKIALAIEARGANATPTEVSFTLTIDEEAAEKMKARGIDLENGDQIAVH